MNIFFATVQTFPPLCSYLVCVTHGTVTEERQVLTAHDSGLSAKNRHLLVCSVSNNQTCLPPISENCNPQEKNQKKPHTPHAELG